MKYLTIPQLAKMMGVSRTTVYRKVKSGEIKATKVGHDYIVDDKEIYNLCHFGNENVKNVLKVLLMVYR